MTSLLLGRPWWSTTSPTCLPLSVFTITSDHHRCRMSLGEHPQKTYSQSQVRDHPTRRRLRHHIARPPWCCCCGRDNHCGRRGRHEGFVREGRGFRSEGYVSSFLQQSDCVAEKMKTIDFILDGKFHLHTPKKEGFRTQVKSR